MAAGGPGKLSPQSLSVLFILLCLAFVLAGLKGLFALFAFWAYGSVILRPPSYLSRISMPSGLFGAFSGGSEGGGGGGGGGPRRPTIRGVGDLPARPRG